MSAQRMALRQPESYTFSAAAEKEIDMWIAKYPADRQRSALIPALWIAQKDACLLYTSPSPRDLSTSRMPSSA